MIEHKEWYSRGYLPHFDHPGLIQMITYRLADALPATVLATLEREAKDDLEKRKRIEAYLDAGHGSCSLRDPRIACMVEDAFLHFDAKRYRLMEWVVMPNHVHVLVEIEPHYQLSGIVHSSKSFTAKEAIKILGTSGHYWQPDYFDRFIRDDTHYSNAVRYIHENPVKAKLVSRAEDWPFGSAARRKQA
jgi:putative DNA methylase